MDKDLVLEIVQNVLQDYMAEIYVDVKSKLEEEIEHKLELHYKGVIVESSSKEGINVEFTIKNGEEVIEIISEAIAINLDTLLD